VGEKLIHISQISGPNLPILFNHFHGATTKIKPCYWRK